MEDTEVSIKDVYLLLKGVNENMGKRIEVLEETTRSLSTAVCKEVEITRNKVEILEKENVTLKNKVSKFEKQLKLNNLVIYGIEENEDENQEKLINTFSELTAIKLEVEIKRIEINNIFRLGKKTGQKRPILVSLGSQIRRQEILRNGPKLKGTKIVITEDLTDEEQKERKILLGALKEARSNNKTAFLTRNKLIVEGETLTAADIENSKELYQKESDFSPITKRRVVSKPPTPFPKEIEREENLPVIEREKEAEKETKEDNIEVESEKEVLKKGSTTAESKNPKEELKKFFGEEFLPKPQQQRPRRKVLHREEA
ncbi:unnamed protein product [Phaedon cochleariae]|uniref:Endonuclease-reverse transcriptase n=1 Tax=Phaedon cochleariae TaxID=80249 RepID=A0A9N9X5B6_PHACE|nr:unnamed protein product [Phaedon cochleariae]